MPHGFIECFFKHTLLYNYCNERKEAKATFFSDSVIEKKKKKKLGIDKSVQVERPYMVLDDE